MKLSKNLTLAEVIKSPTAMRKGISNEPTIEHMENLKLIAENIFQPLRDKFGVPIGVSSGYRSPDLNKAIGGSITSQHCKGQALDIDADMFGGVTNKEIFDYIKDSLDFDQLIWEFGNKNNPAWVHCSFISNGNRRQILRAIKKNGRTGYELY
jgi:hypothetical protein